MGFAHNPMRRCSTELCPEKMD